MNTPGLAILIGGAILLVSELVFLMPIRRKQLNQQKEFQENIDRLNYHLHEMRRAPVEIDPSTPWKRK